MSEKREPKEEILRGFIENSRRVLHGLAADQLQESPNWVGKLVQVGHLSEDQADLVQRRLQAQGALLQQVFQQQTQVVLKDVVQRLQHIVKEELTEIEQRLSRLETSSSKLQPKQL